MNENLVKNLNRIYDNAESNYNNSKEDIVQKSLIRIVNLSNDNTYQQFVNDALNRLSLEPVDEIKENLRSNIVNELNTDDEPLVAPDADDLAYLDKHTDKITFANYNNVASLPTLSDLNQIMNYIISEVKQTKFQMQ